MVNREIFERSLQCFADPPRRQEYLELYSDSIVPHGYQGVGPGLASVRQFYFAFWKTFPEAQVIHHDLLVEGDTLVVRYTITGTLRDPSWASPQPDKRVRSLESAFCTSEMANASSAGPAPILWCSCIRSARLCLRGRNSFGTPIKATRL